VRSATRRLLAIALCVSAAASAAADSVEDWLLRMDHAVESLSYRGTLVSTGADRIDTLRVLHRVDEHGVRERIYALDGPKREVLRDRDRVQCLIAGQASLIVDNPFPTRLFPRIPLAEILGPDSAYAADLAGTGRVAARSARIIEIRPRDRYRYGRRLWLDEDTGMLLRSVVFDANGEVIEKLSFVEIELGATIRDEELDSDLDDPSRLARYQIGDPGADGPASSAPPAWLPSELPRGFRLASVGHGSAAGQGYEHLLFSDGMSSFSIYVEPADNAAIAEHVEARGAMHIYTGSLDGRMVTVVGEVPAPTVRMVGRHLRRLESGSVVPER
jgi:sigma-E factor negative regulatory protein RseB